MLTPTERRRIDAVEELIEMLKPHGLNANASHDTYRDAVGGMMRWMASGGRQYWPLFSLVVVNTNGTHALTEDGNAIHQLAMFDPSALDISLQSMLDDSAVRFANASPVVINPEGSHCELVGVRKVEDGFSDVELMFLYESTAEDPNAGNQCPSFEWTPCARAGSDDEFVQGVLQHAQDLKRMGGLQIPFNALGLTRS